LKELVTDRLS